MATGTDHGSVEADEERPGCLIAIAALLPAVWTAAFLGPIIILSPWFPWGGVALALGPTALAVVLMLRSRRGIVRKDGGWDIIIILNILALLYGITMLYWWLTGPAGSPL